MFQIQAKIPSVWSVLMDPDNFLVRQIKSSLIIVIQFYVATIRDQFVNNSSLKGGCTCGKCQLIFESPGYAQTDPMRGDPWGKLIRHSNS